MIQQPEIDEAGVLRALRRVLEMCEAMAGPKEIRSRWFVTFDDGDTAMIADVMTEGRTALCALADRFGQAVPAPSAEEPAHG